MKLSPNEPFRVQPGASRRLSAEIWLWRHGWLLPLAVVALLVSGAAGSVAWQELRASREALLQEATELRDFQRPQAAAGIEAPVSAPVTVAKLLEDAPSHAAAMRVVIEQASQNGISLPQGRYAQDGQAASGIESTEVTLGFTAGYGETRAFMEGVLRDIPTASIDRVLIERKQVRGAQAEVKLYVTLWRSGAGRQPAESRQ